MCPRCGADYAKAEAIKAHGRAAPAADLPAIAIEEAEPAALEREATANGEWAHVDDADLEWKFCIGAMPIALCIALVFNVSGLGASLQRIFLTMPVHELGHAVTAWFCGFAAIPTLWKTLVPETRGFIAPLALLGALGHMTYRAHAGNKRIAMVAGIALIVLQAIATLVIKPDTATMLITFGGDGMGMILAVLLMASFYFGKNTQLYKGSLRWGFVLIGAASFVDIFATWWKARSDEGAIPYGTTGGMATDSMTLVDVYGWSMQALVNRYLFLGICCMLLLAAVYTWGLLAAKAEMDKRQLAQKRGDWAMRKR